MEFPSWLGWVGYLVGVQWPEGNEDTMRELSRAYNTARDELRSVVPDLMALVPQIEQAYPQGAGGESIQDRMRELTTGNGGVNDLVTGLGDLGTAGDNMATELESTKLMFYSSLGIAAADIIAAWAFPPTAPEAEATIVALTRQAVGLIRNRSLAEIDKVAQAAARAALQKFLLRHVGLSAALGAGQDLGVQAYERLNGHGAGINWGEVAITGASGGIAAIGGRLFNDAAGGFLENQFGRLAEGLGLEAGGTNYRAVIAGGKGFVSGPLAGGAMWGASSAMSGRLQPFDPSMLTAGAFQGLVGGATHVYAEGTPGIRGVYNTFRGGDAATVDTDLPPTGGDAPASELPRETAAGGPGVTPTADEHPDAGSDNRATTTPTESDRADSAVATAEQPQEPTGPVEEGQADSGRVAPENTESGNTDNTQSPNAASGQGTQTPSESVAGGARTVGAVSAAAEPTRTLAAAGAAEPGGATARGEALVSAARAGQAVAAQAGPVEPAVGDRAGEALSGDGFGPRPGGQDSVEGAAARAATVSGSHDDGHGMDRPSGQYDHRAGEHTADQPDPRHDGMKRDSSGHEETSPVESDRAPESDGTIRTLQDSQGWARRAYDAICRSDDLPAIEASLAHLRNEDGTPRYSPADLAKVKSHLFYDRHPLAASVDGHPVEGTVEDRFEENPDIAEAWLRLQSGRHLPEDLTLLDHELAEIAYRQTYPEASHAEAHAAANETANWERSKPPPGREDYAQWSGPRQDDPRGPRPDYGPGDRRPTTGQSGGETNGPPPDPLDPVYRANHDPEYFREYYRRDGTRVRVDRRDDNGRIPPQLVKDANGDWIAKHDAPPPIPGVPIEGKDVRFRRDDGTSRADLPDLDAKAKDRRIAIDDDTPWHARMKDAKDAGDQTKLDDLRAQHAPMHDRMSKASEEYGEAVAAHAVRQHYPDAVEPEELAGPKNGNDQFDQVWRLLDGRFVVVEAKSSMNTELGERQIAEGGTAMQMSRAYFLDILEKMRERGAAGDENEERLAEELDQAYREGKVDYVLIRGDSETVESWEYSHDQYAGYRMVHYDIRPEVPADAAHDAAEREQARQASQNVVDRVTGVVERGAAHAEQQARGNSPVETAEERAAVAHIEEGKAKLQALIEKIAATGLARPEVFDAWRMTDGSQVSVEATVGGKVERVMFSDGVEYPLASIENRVLAGHDLLTIAGELAGEHAGGIAALRARLDAIVDAARSREWARRSAAGHTHSGTLDTAVQALRDKIDALIGPGFHLDTYQELLRAKSIVTVTVLSDRESPRRYELFDAVDGTGPRLVPMTDEVEMIHLTHEIASGKPLAANRGVEASSYRTDLRVENWNEARALGMKALLDNRAAEEINAAAAAGTLSPDTHTLWQRIRDRLPYSGLTQADQAAALELRNRVNRHVLDGVDLAEYEAWRENTSLVLPFEIEHGAHAGSMVLMDGRLIPRYSRERDVAAIEHETTRNARPSSILHRINRIHEGHPGVRVETAAEAMAQEERLTAAVERIRQEVGGALDEHTEFARGKPDEEAALEMLRQQVPELLREGFNPDVYDAWTHAERYTHIRVKGEEAQHFMTVLDLGGEDLRIVPSRSPEEALDWIRSMIEKKILDPQRVLYTYQSHQGELPRVRADDPRYVRNEYFDVTYDYSTNPPRLLADDPAQAIELVRQLKEQRQQFEYDIETMEQNEIAAAYQAHEPDMPGHDEAIEDAIRDIRARGKRLRDAADELFRQTPDPRLVERAMGAFDGKENVSYTREFSASGEHFITVKLEPRGHEHTAASDMARLRELTEKRAEALARLQNADRQLASGKGLEERRLEALTRVREAAAARARELAIEQQRVQERLQAQVRRLAEQREQQLREARERLEAHEQARDREERERALDPNNASGPGMNDERAKEIWRLLEVITQQQQDRERDQLRDHVQLIELELSQLRDLEQALALAPRTVELGQGVPELTLTQELARLIELDPHERAQELARLLGQNLEMDGPELALTQELGRLAGLDPHERAEELARLLEGLAMDGPGMTVEQQLGRLNELGSALNPNLTRDLAEDFGRPLDPALALSLGMEGPAKDAVSLDLKSPELGLGQLAWATRETNGIHVMEVMTLADVMARMARDHDFLREYMALNRHVDERAAELARRMGHEIAPDPRSPERTR